MFGTAGGGYEKCQHVDRVGSQSLHTNCTPCDKKCGAGSAVPSKNKRRQMERKEARSLSAPACHQKIKRVSPAARLPPRRSSYWHLAMHDRVVSFFPLPVTQCPAGGTSKRIWRQEKICMVGLSPSLPLLPCAECQYHDRPCQQLKTRR